MTLRPRCWLPAVLALGLALAGGLVEWWALQRARRQLARWEA